MSIFRKYDIRGIYPSELNEKNSALIAKAFFQYINENFKTTDFVVGYDARLSSPKIKKAVVDAIVSSGGEVFDLGMVTTPLVNFAIAHYNHGAGLIITASHNPKEYNGIKLIGQHALQLYYEKGISKVEILFRQFSRGNYDFKLQSKGRVVNEHDKVIKEYIEHIFSFYDDTAIRRFRRGFAIDFLNGVGYVTAKPFLEKAKLHPLLLHEKPDGNFPNCLPNPLDENNLRDLKNAVMSKKLDFGISFDGDADRLVVVDERGSLIAPDYLFGLLVSRELENKPGKTVYVDPRFSQGVVEALEERGAHVVILRVGNPYYKEALYDDDSAVAAAEFSGHIMFKQNYGIDDGLFSMIKFLNIVNTSDEKVSELIRPFVRYFKSQEINFRLKNDRIADKIISRLKRQYSDGKISLIDGLKVNYPDWWFIVRKSNTEPLLRLILEAKTKPLLDKKELELRMKINEMNK